MPRIESQHTEWKESWRDDLLRWVCGFANAEGGRLEIHANRRTSLQSPRAKGPAPYQPRATPWVVRPKNPPSPEGAIHPPRPHMARPFRAQWKRNPKPRALPWAGMRRTVGAEERIFEACENAGTPAPVIDYKPNDLWLEFPFSPEYLKAIRQGEEGEPSNKVGEKVGEKLSKNRQMILEAIRLNPKISQKQLAVILGIATKNIETNIHYLKKNGYLKRIGPAKGGYWEVTQ